jgi:mRNA interferase MazF
MRRGEVRWYAFGPPNKRRPVLVLTRDSAIGFLSMLTVAPITTTMRSIPSEVFLGPADGMPTECAVNLDNIQTVSKAKVGPLITSLPAEQMLEVQRAVGFALGFD